MITDLQISGLAIISKLSISFEDGFNVITGETGAGKSILIKALNLLLGQKAQPDSVRQGFDHAQVIGTFSVKKNHKVLAVLSDKGITYDCHEEETLVIIRRQISVKGRSQAWINDTPVAVHTLKQIGLSLIDVFAQHQTHKIFDPGRHLKIVDRFLKDQELIEKVHQLHKQSMADLRSILDIVSNFSTRQRDEDYFQFRYRELADFAPSKKDYEEVSKNCQQAEKGFVIREVLDKLQNSLDYGSDGESLSSILWSLTSQLQKIIDIDERFKELLVDLEEIASRCDDLSFKVGRLASDEGDYERDLEETQERLARYQELFRKFAVQDAEELTQEMQSLEQHLKSIENATEIVEEKIDSLAKKVARLSKLSQQLSRERHKASKDIKKRVESELKDLGMKGAQFDVSFSPYSAALPAIEMSVFCNESVSEKWTAVSEELSCQGEWGNEKAEFFLAANPGEPSLPLVKVASGGEVSRIMLALKKALLAGADACILVFDEIDTGISGRIANMVGQKMRELSESFQLICISHLPQVAAFADCHFLVEKIGKGKRTESNIRALDKNESVEELAKLLSGDQLSETSINHAKILKEKALQR